MVTDGARHRAPARTRRAARHGAYAALGLLLGLGCFAQRPSGESAPRAAPESPAPASAPLEPAPPPAPAGSIEPQQQAPAPELDAAESSAGAPASAASAPRAPQKKAAAPARAMPESKAAQDRSDLGGSLHEGSNPRALRERLDRAYRAGSPDCPTARDRKKAVCDLASQICQLIDRDPNVASVAEYCADAKGRCAEAERRTRERCPD